MSVTVKRVAYFRTELEDRPGEAYKLLADLVKHEVNLLAVQAFPIGPSHTQFTLFPESAARLARAAESLALRLIGPNEAIIVSGDDRMGALIEFHEKLAEAGVNVYAASGVSDGKGHYGYVIHVKPDEVEKAATILGAK